MKGLRVKICGIKYPDQGRAIAEMGATALGFICASSSPRYVTPEQIAAIAAALPCFPETNQPRVDRVGVFVNASLEQIAQTVLVGRLNGVQLHGEESPEFCQALRDRLPHITLIKALRIRNLDALQVAIDYEQLVDTLLLDAYHPQLVGGTGQTLDWQALQQFQPRCAWWLAGGLTPDNLLIALQSLSPQGVDLSSGVENAPGDKNLLKVASLFENLRSHQSQSLRGAWHG